VYRQDHFRYRVRVALRSGKLDAWLPDVRVDNNMAYVQTFLPEFTRHDLRKGPKSKPADRKVQVILAPDQSRSRSDEHDPTTVQGLHAPRGLPANDESRETIGPPTVLKSVHLHVNRLAWNTFLH
jgi:hypothetical protein